MEVTFGPVPSRRPGHSLGINNIPPKHCSYSCIYCQVGPTAAQEIAPRAFGFIDRESARGQALAHPLPQTRDIEALKAGRDQCAFVVVSASSQKVSLS